MEVCFAVFTCLFCFLWPTCGAYEGRMAGSMFSWVYKFSFFLVINAIWGPHWKLWTQLYNSLTHYWLSWEREWADQSDCPECCSPNNLSLNDQGRPLFYWILLSLEFSGTTSPLRIIFSPQEVLLDLVSFQIKYCLFSFKFHHHFWETSTTFYCFPGLL